MKPPSPAAERITLRVIPAAEADFAGLAALVNRAFATYPFLREERTSPESARDEAGDTGMFILAEDDGVVVGCALIRPAADLGSIVHRTGEPNPPDALYLGMLAISPGAMRGGIGRRLVARAEAEALARGFQRTILGTIREMGNVEYYARAGYRSYAIEDYEAGHWGMDIAVQYHAMEKQLAG